MPALMLAAAPGSRSTYTSAERVCGSTVGPTMRTRPWATPPLAALSVTAWPGLTRARSAAVTSARHSSLPWRISRNSSVPAGTTAPRVALRAVTMPLSGASTWAWRNRSSCTASMAWADSTRACAVTAAVVSWAICCSLMAPVVCRLRARSALVWASTALALASASAARLWATSARTPSASNTASTWPAFTVSPTAARSSVRRRPLASAATLTSCQAATLPLAVRVWLQEARAGLATVTVMAGLALDAAASAPASAARPGMGCQASSSATARATAETPDRAKEREERGP